MSFNLLDPDYDQKITLPNGNQRYFKTVAEEFSNELITMRMCAFITKGSEGVKNFDENLKREISAFQELLMKGI